ncbi:MAG: helix-turn-helix transcriptional regulator [Rhizobiaceae bacterium]|nr:helix-turn-helix transcriptional regulator [Rhizobiaceae bacterium]
MGTKKSNTKEFSGEVGTGSPPENAKQESRAFERSHLVEKCSRQTAAQAAIEDFVSLLGDLSLDGIPLAEERVWKQRAFEIAGWLPGETRQEIIGRMRRVRDAAATVDLAGFAGRHGLTPAETQLLAHFADGTSIAQYAEKQAISVNTARVHMQRILEKTGTSRQTDLMRMLWAFGPACDRSSNS